MVQYQQIARLTRQKEAVDMTEQIKARILAILPSVRALAQWLVLAGLTGIACGLAGAAFTWCVAQATALRSAHPWLLFCMPVAGLIIVFSYRTAGMANDSGTNQIIASVRGRERPPLRLAPNALVTMPSSKRGLCQIRPPAAPLACLSPPPLAAKSGVASRLSAAASASVHASEGKRKISPPRQQ